MTTANPAPAGPGGAPPSAAPASPAPAAPAAPQTPAQPAAPAPAQGQGTDFRQMTPEQFAARLEDAKASGAKSTLSALGLESVDAGKARLTKAAELERASMTEAEKAAARIKELEPQATNATRFEAALKAHLEASEKAIPEAQRGKLDLAPKDPVERLDWINRARAAGVFDSQAQTPTQPANSRAGTAPPAPIQPGQKHPRDMTPAEFQAYQAEKFAGYRTRVPAAQPTPAGAPGTPQGTPR